MTVDQKLLSKGIYELSPWLHRPQIYMHLYFLYPHRVFSAFIKEVDGKTNTDTIWGKKSSFGSCLSEFSNGRGILDK